MLLVSPRLAQGWNAHLGAIRSGLTLDARLRELAICAVAVLNGADYELEHHLPIYLAAGGSERAAETLRSLEVSADSRAPFGEAPVFSDGERAVLELTAEMTRRVRVSDATFERVRATLGGDQPTVELIAVVATYNMVSRFLVALDIEGEAR
jgi:alkylhydroperoxidase family enzyme